MQNVKTGLSITRVSCILLFIEDSKQKDYLWNVKIHQARKYTEYKGCNQLIQLHVVTNQLLSTVHSLYELYNFKTIN